MAFRYIIFTYTHTHTWCWTNKVPGIPLASIHGEDSLKFGQLKFQKDFMVHVTHDFLFSISELKLWSVVSGFCQSGGMLMLSRYFETIWSIVIKMHCYSIYTIHFVCNVSLKITLLEIEWQYFSRALEKITISPVMLVTLQITCITF